MNGMTFQDAEEARTAIANYDVKFGYKLKIKPNEKNRLAVKCLNEDGCPFRLWISQDGKNSGLAVKVCNAEHKCFRHYSIPSATQKWLANYFKGHLQKDPNFRVAAMKEEAEKKLKINVSLYKCKRAKRLIIQEMDGSYKAEFGYLEAYAATLKRSNPGSKAEIELCNQALKDGRRVFKRMFICFNALKQNWLAGCRRIIGVDGCFLKGVCKGILLSAVGLDGDGQMIPIAWAVVDKENKSNWRWFLCWLVQELDLKSGAELTLISDMQKGLIIAAQDVIPDAEHRFCARHVYANWSKKWRGDQFCKKFWICAWSTYEEELQMNLKRLGKLSHEAAADLLKYPIQTWCRAYFSNRSKCWMVDNNITESFNSWIREARSKPIVSMLEDIRLKAMKRISDFKLSHQKWINDWSPSCMEYYQDNKEAATGCNIIFNGDVGFEIGEGEDKHTVVLDKKMCTCRAWELTGIPCLHALCALYYKKVDVLTYISRWYHKDTYMAAYQHSLQPVPGKAFMRVDEYEAILPPPVQNLPGRPKKNRVRASNETKGPGSGSKLVANTSHRASRKGQVQTCGICHVEGHKRAKCPNKERDGTTGLREDATSGSVSTPMSVKRAASVAFLPLPRSTETEHAATTMQATERSKGISKLTCRRIARTKGKQPATGFGCYVDVNTGAKTINPGMDSEQVVSELPNVLAHDPDVNVRFAIPNEKQIRGACRVENHMDVPKYRTISFKGDGAQVKKPTNLPFEAPGLQWNGKKAISARQLIKKSQMRKDSSIHIDIVEPPL